MGSGAFIFEDCEITIDEPSYKMVNITENPDGKDSFRVDIDNLNGTAQCNYNHNKKDPKISGTSTFTIKQMTAQMILDYETFTNPETHELGPKIGVKYLSMDYDANQVDV